jgi:ribonuclease-3
MKNIKNTLITRNEVNGILNTYISEKDIKIHELFLYQRAFANECFLEEEKGCVKNMAFEKSNETLETVGDSILGAIVVEYLESRFTTQDEGFISLLKMSITKTEGLDYFSKELKLDKFILISTETENVKLQSQVGEKEIEGRNNPELMENCFEAFIGAIFLDNKKHSTSGDAYNICYKFIVSLIENLIDFSNLILKKDNYKNILQHFFHKRKWQLPTYIDINMEKDMEDRKIYTRGIYIEKQFLLEKELWFLLNHYKEYNNIKNGKILIGLGTSYKKKSADQICAKAIMEVFCPKDLEIDIHISF